MIGTTNADNNIKLITIEGTMPSSASTWSSYYSLPSGWTDLTRVHLASFEMLLASDNTWRSGSGCDSSTYTRNFAALDSNGLRVYNTSSTWVNRPFRIALIYI